ncbi:hypothetical protein UC35_11835 [Ramlibacter tataouinensis]|uniref:Uncharacterized protein n=1 Tax=Ramlibacter tataouinensis TaxID=94132 RepID=A0A127JUA3_9BURK|nr:hypothetical protein UC35_11835 [Ramlibacter tataouinensis]
MRLSLVTISSAVGHRPAAPSQLFRRELMLKGKPLSAAAYMARFRAAQLSLPALYRGLELGLLWSNILSNSLRL